MQCTMSTLRGKWTGKLVCVTVRSGDRLNSFGVRAARLRLMPGDARGQAGAGGGGWTRQHEDSCTLMQLGAVALQHRFVKIHNVVVVVVFFYVREKLVQLSSC